jgi:hypothetical protein
LLAEGESPWTAWDANGAVAPKPADKPTAKRGFSVPVFAPKFGGLREFSSTSNGAIIAIKNLYDTQFENAPERTQGLVPIVRCEKVLPVKSRYGTNYEPVLKLVKWVARPAGLPAPESTPAVTAAAPKGTVATELNDEIPF